MPQPTYPRFVFDQIRRYARAWLSVNPLPTTVSGFQAPGEDVPDLELLAEKFGDLAWRALVDQKPPRQIFEEIGVNPADFLEPQDAEAPLPFPPIPPPPPIDVITPLPPLPPSPSIDAGALKKMPRVGLTIHQLLNDTRWDYRRFADTFGKHANGRGICTVNIFTAPFPHHGFLDNAIWPWAHAQDGRADLYALNERYIVRAMQIRDYLNAAGIVVQFCLLELYSWSDRKKVDFDQNRAWPRYNTNMMRWAADDSTLIALPDRWLTDFLNWLVPALDGPGVLWKLGNEMPEKNLHKGLRNVILNVAPKARFTVNRNEDTPGQYDNMNIGSDYDFIEFHAWDNIHFAERKFPKEPIGRPLTFEQFFHKRDQMNRLLPIELHRVIASSDGCRKRGDAGLDPVNPYDWKALAEVAEYVLGNGASYEHQSRVKLAPPNLANIEWDFYDRLRSHLR